MAHWSGYTCRSFEVVDGDVPAFHGKAQDEAIGFNVEGSFLKTLDCAVFDDHL